MLIRAFAVVAVLLLASCGGGGAGGEGSPAHLVPADARFYAEAVVRPEGSLRADALDAASKVLVTDDPEGRVREIVERALAARGEEIDYERDVAPWIGERAAVWVEPSKRAYDPSAVLLAATDTEAAREALTAVLERGGHGATERSYRGSDYLESSGVAAGVVDNFVAIAPEAMYKRTVEAAEGESLAESDEYADRLDALPDERLGHFWVDTSELLDRHGDPMLEQIRALAGELPPVAGAFLANGDRLELEVQVPETPAFGGTPLLQELPADSWAAIGSADLGASVRDAINRFGGALGSIAIRGRLRRELGLDLDRDLLDWMGHAGFFVRGRTPATIEGGLVIQVTDTRRATDAFGRIVGAIQQAASGEARPVEVVGADQAFAIYEESLHRPIVVALGAERVVATTGAAAAEAALGTGDQLGDTDLYAEAEELVGMEPNVLISMPQVLELLGSDDEDARRFLEPYTVLAVGVAEDGVARAAAGLR